jgi:protein O-GlcNAc transferase
MADTGLLVSSHSSQLANAMFLHPGSAVLELIHRNWNFPMDISFKVN